MVETSNFEFQLMEFSDTMGDQALFNNENFKKLDAELTDIESIVESISEEGPGKIVVDFDNAMALSERYRAMETEFGGVQILRGTQKEHSSFFGDGEWTKGTFNTSIASTDLSVKKFNDDRIESEGRPISQLKTYIHRKGMNGSPKNFEEIFKQKNIPIQNQDWYTLSFYGRVSEYVLGEAGSTGLPVTLRVALTLENSITEDNYETIKMNSYGWEKYTAIFSTEELFTKQVDGNYINGAFYDSEGNLITGTYGTLYTDIATENTYYWSRNNSVYVLLKEGRLEEAKLEALFRNFIVADDKNNSFDICGIQLSSGIYSNDWNLSPDDINDEDARLQSEINKLAAKVGDLNQLTTDVKSTIVGAINEVDAHVDGIIASKGREDHPQPTARIATLDPNGYVPAAQLDKDYVHNVNCYANRSSFPSSGVQDAIYIDMSKNEIYRWNVNTYVNLTYWATNSDIDGMFV